MNKYRVKERAKLLEFLIGALAPQSRTKVKGLLGGARICVNGRVETAFDKVLEEGDEVSVLDKAAVMAASKRKSLDKRLKIRYEDDYILVVEKQAGLPTISTGKENETTAYSILTEYVRNTSNGRIFIVHRLDRDTSGLLVFAKDEKTKRKLQDNWNEAVIDRKYSTVVEGCPKKPSGTIISWLTENPKSLKINVSPTDNGGKKAITNYNVRCSANGMSLLDVELETGRKNQIRAQLAYIGHPIVGDKKYGPATRKPSHNNPFGRLALHASTLTFIHPATGRRMSFEAPTPFREYFG